MTGRALILAALTAMVAWYFLRADRLPMLDFTAFYCGGHVVAIGANPYLVEPLHSCEQRLGLERDLTLPAPIPGYVLAGYALLSRMPYYAARIVYLVFFLAALAIETVALSLLFRQPALFILAALSPIAYICILDGQFLPVAASSAICLCALFFTKQRYAMSAVAAGAAMCEPHIGFPVVLSLLLVRQTRVGVTLVCSALAAISIATLGLRTNVEYFETVLPAHAQSEVSYMHQYGIPWMAHVLGATSATALEIGTLLSVVTVVVVLLLVRKLAATSRSPEAFVLLPPIAALCGTVFLHLTQVIVAVPAAIFFVYRYGNGTMVPFAALLLVMIPWTALVVFSPFTDVTVFAILMTLVCGLYIGSYLRVALSRRVTLALSATALVSAGIVVTHEVAKVFPSVPVHHAVAGFAPNALASASWKAFLDARYPLITTQDLAAKVPTWIGLLLLVVILVWKSQVFPKAAAERHKRVQSGDALPSIAVEVGSSEVRE